MEQSFRSVRPQLFLVFPHSRIVLSAILLLASAIAAAQSGQPGYGPLRPDPQNVLRGLVIASVTGTSQDSIQATATDSSGDIYVAGTTDSALFPVKNAEQPVFGESTILRTTDLGVTWTHVASPPGGASVVVADPIVPQVIFASTPIGIFKSADSGQTWQLVDPITASSMAIDPGNHLHIAAVTGSGTLVRSLDGGATWTVGGTCGISCNGKLLVDPAGSGALLVISLNISISRDWGSTFQSFGPAGGVGTPSAAAFDPSHPGWIYVAQSAGVTGTLYLTTDYGATWTQKGSPPSVFSDILYVAVDPALPNILLAALANGFYKSSDGGASWTLQAPFSTSGSNFLPETYAPFLLSPASCGGTVGLFALGDGVPGSFGVSFSPDLGITWTTPQLTQVLSITAGPDCTLYATRTSTSDAFVAKIARDGGTLWATFLGGSDRDAPVALALDAQGNVYVAGNTSSPDFPVSVPHIGPHGEDSVFVARFSTNGALTYSATLGGEALNSAIALAVDASQNAYLAGTTDSLRFPTTPGTIITSLEQGSYSGFLVKISPSATLSLATYLGASYTLPGAILVDTNQEVTVAGSGATPVSGGPSGQPSIASGLAPQFVMKLDHNASQVLESAYLPAAQANNGGSVTGMATDSQNNLVLFGQTGGGSLSATPGAFSSQVVSSCDSNPGPETDDAYVMKLRAADWQPTYIAIFTAMCGIETGAIAIDATGSAVLAMGASSGLSLRSPVVGAAPCTVFSSAIAKLSADGSTLQFATYLPDCGIPAIALGANGEVYAGVSPLPSENATSVLGLKTAQAATISLDQVSNAFSGDTSAVVGGGSYSVAISGFEPETVNLGLNPTGNLPVELDRVQVTFDGVPASILATAPGRIIVAAPPLLPVRASARTGGVADGGPPATLFTSIEVVYNNVPSNPVWMPVSNVLPGLLTVDFPNVISHSNYADANALNQDGTQNDVNHPAPAGSTITLFATGMGVTVPLVAPGAIALSATVSPVIPTYSSWERSGPNSSAAPLAVSSMPGFILAVFQIPVQAPANIESSPGTDLGNGVRRVEIALQLSVPIDSPGQPVSNVVAVYVR